MPSSKTNDYDVEKIVDKRVDANGRSFYLIKWKGYSSSENTWEPENHVNNCQALIQAFENEQTKKKQASPSTRRSNGSLSKENQRTSRSRSRSRSRHSTKKQRTSKNQANQSLLTDDEEEDDVAVGRKRPNSKASPRRSATSIQSHPKGDTSSEKNLDTVKIESIVDTRRNRLTNQVEYQVHAKSRKNFWISSDVLVKGNAEKIIQYFEKNYV